MKLLQFITENLFEVPTYYNHLSQHPLTCFFLFNILGFCGGLFVFKGGIEIVRGSALALGCVPMVLPECNLPYFV